MSSGGQSGRRQTLIADIASAFLLLSRIPIFWHHFPEDRPPNFMTALWAFPLVGLIIGAGGVERVIEVELSKVGVQTLHLPPLFSALIGVFIMAMLSGAMHEDGLADMADGFGGGRDLEAKVRIMHDSRIGTYGVLALILGTGARIILLAELSATVTGSDLVAIIAVVAAAARFQPVIQLAVFPISAHAKLASLVGRAGIVQLVAAALLWAAPLYVLLGVTTLLVMYVPALILTLWLGRLAVKHVEGLTGDVMGATTILSEIALFAALVAYMGYLAA